MLAKFKLRTQLFSGTGLILILMMVVSLVVYMSINSLLQTFERVDHTYKVLAEASAIEAAAVDMETGMRGYLLAGKEEFLAPYKAGDKRFQKLIGKLAKTVDDNPAQVQLLAETAEIIDQWKKNVTEPAIEFRKQVGAGRTMDDVAALVAEAKGKVYFDKFREQIKTFKDREASLMGARMEAFEATSARAINVAIFGTLFAVVVGFGIVIILTRNIMRQLGGEPAYIADIAKNVADGDLNVNLQSEGKD